VLKGVFGAGKESKGEMVRKVEPRGKRLANDHKRMPKKREDKARKWASKEFLCTL